MFDKILLNVLYVILVVWVVYYTGKVAHWFINLDRNIMDIFLLTMFISTVFIIYRLGLRSGD